MHSGQSHLQSVRRYSMSSLSLRCVRLRARRTTDPPMRTANQASCACALSPPTSANGFGNRWLTTNAEQLCTAHRSIERAGAHQPPTLRHGTQACYKSSGLFETSSRKPPRPLFDTLTEAELQGRTAHAHLHFLFRSAVVHGLRFAPQLRLPRRIAGVRSGGRGRLRPATKGTRSEPE